MKRIVAIALLLALVIGGGYAIAAGGTSDPLVSLSYLLDTVKDALLSKAETETEKQIGSQIGGYVQRLENAANFQSSDMAHTTQFTALNFSEGTQLELGHFACFMPTGGKFVLRIEKGDVIDISKGETVADGTLLTLNHKYFAAENSAAYVLSYTDNAEGFIDGYYCINENAGFAADEVFYDLFGHWSAEYVYELYNAGIVDGVDNHRFAPGATVNRAMLVTILGRVSGIDTKLYSQTGFSDVDISQWYGPYVAWAQKNGIVEGYDDGTFKPNDNVTREQMALIFMRFARYVGVTVSEEESIAFADEAKISSWALEAVLYAQSTGLINGKDGNRFDPGGTATRAEVCTVTTRFISNLL